MTKLFFAASIFFIAVASNALNLQKCPWELQLDPTGKKSIEDIKKSPASAWKQVQPAICWDAQGLKLPRNKENGQRVGWQRCKFTVPKDYDIKKPLLHIGAIDDFDTTWLNGKKIGSTGSDTPSYWSSARKYPVPEDLLLKGAENTLLIRVTDLRGDGGIASLPLEIIDGSKIKTAIEIPNPMKMRMYPQVIEVEFATEEEAKKATLVFASLFEDKQWAFSARWDDNSSQNLPMRDLMEKYGFKGTFYLYSTFRGNPKGYPKTGKDYALKLIKGGFSIGGHSMTHPPFSTIPRNEMFYESAAIKVERETDTNMPINSFAFAGGNYRNPYDRNAHRDIGEALARCGYHHNTYNGFVSKDMGVMPKATSSVLNVCPGDRDSDCKKFDSQVDQWLKNKRQKKANPNMTLGIHVWHTKDGWANLEKSLKKYANRPDWWYCNQNEYAAYRYQLHHSTLNKISQKGKVCSYKLTRPNAADSGNNVPLTVKVKDASATSVKINSKKTQIKNGKFNVMHDALQKTPTAIDAIQNAENLTEPDNSHVSGKFPGIRFFLYFDKTKKCLKLTAENKSKEALANIRAMFRLPLVYTKGFCAMKLKDLAPGGKETMTLALGKTREEPEFQDGRAYFVAQIDFTQGGKIGRLYATARENKKLEPLACPRDLAYVLAPVPENEIDLKAIQSMSEPGGKLLPVNGRKWRAPSPKRSSMCAREYVDLSLIGKADRQIVKKGKYCMVVSLDFICKDPQTKISCLTWRFKPQFLFANGKESPQINTLSGMRKGKNRIILLFKCEKRPPGKILIALRPQNIISFEKLQK